MSATKSSPQRQLIVERRDRVLSVKFNRPSAKNALNRRAYYELIRALNDANHDATVSIVAISGVGDTFTAGNDLTQTRDCADISEFFKSSNYVLRALVRAFIHCSKVVVALVQGPCIGIGFTLSALCDIVYCTETAYFQAPFTKLGICPEACSSYLMPLILGRSKATEALLFGEKLTAQDALRFNFVACIFKNEDLDSIAWPRIMQYSLLPPEALRISKKLLRLPERQTLLTALKAECDELEKLRYSEVYLNSLESFFLNKQRKSKL